MTLSSIAGIGSGLFAIGAAGLWFWSASMALPPGTIARIDADGWHSPPRETAMEKQGRISASAAACAGVAALLQVFSAYTAP